MHNELNTVDVDRSLENAIVIVDGKCCTETWEEHTPQWGQEPANEYQTCQSVVDNLSRYLVEKKILKETPSVVLMSTHQAEHTLVPAGRYALPVAPPLVVLTFRAYRFTEDLHELYGKAGIGKQKPPITMIDNLEGQAIPFDSIHQAMKNDVIQNYIAGAILSSAHKREMAVRRPAPLMGSEFTKK